MYGQIITKLVQIFRYIQIRFNTERKKCETTHFAYIIHMFNPNLINIKISYERSRERKRDRHFDPCL